MRLRVSTSTWGLVYEHVARRDAPYRHMFKVGVSWNICLDTPQSSDRRAAQPMSRSSSSSSVGVRLGLPCAVLNQESKKGQDRHAVLEMSSGISAFGVYDGHGGDECAEALKEALLPRLLAQGFPADQEITDAFWAIDAEAGTRMAQQDCHAGSTCTVLIVGTPLARRDSQRLSRRSTVPEIRELRCKLAWVGDSSALVVSMQGSDYSKTTPHTPETEAESKQLLRLAEVNQRLRALQGKKEDVFAAVPEDERKRRKVRSEEWVVSGER